MKTTVTRMLALAALVTLPACKAGQAAHQYAVANSPGGVRVTLVLDDRTLRNAELLEVSDSAVLVLTGSGALIRAYYTRVRSIAPDAGATLVLGGYQPRAGRLTQLRALSRFPQGLTPAQLDTLQGYYARPPLEVIRKDESRRS